MCDWQKELKSDSSNMMPDGVEESVMIQYLYSRLKAERKKRSKSGGGKVYYVGIHGGFFSFLLLDIDNGR